MASGYIGKISAVVTANTSDLTKKLNDAGQDTKRFSENLNRSISSAANSAQNSLQKIFTPLQNIERRLQTSLKVPGLDLPLDKIRAAVSLTEQINKPLARVVSGFNGLSLEVQGAFLPALQRAQDQAVSLNLQLENTGKVSERSFAQAQRSIDNLIAAQSRLQQAQSLSARGLTGNELQFTNPRVYESLQRSARLTSQAGGLPPERLGDGNIAEQVRQISRFQQVIQRRSAEVESLRITPNVDTERLAEAEKRLERIISVARRSQDALESAIAPRPSSSQIAENEIKALIAREQRAKATEEQIYAIKKQAADKEIADLIAREQRAKATEEQIYAIKKQIADKEIADLIAREQRAKATEEQIYAIKKQIADKEIADLIAREQRAKATEEQIYAIKKQAADKEIADLIAKQQRAKQIESLTNNNRSSQFLTSFGGGTGGLSAAFDERAIRSYSAQLQVLQAAISKVSSEARGPAYTAFLKLRDAIADAMDRGELETEQTRQKLKALTTEAVNATASITGIGAKGLGRSVERAGDVGRAGFDKFSLAANQAAFAIDDFLSATGGIEFRIRAVQNNLTQLAFILGGTTGLFVGLGVAIGAQAAIALSQFINEGRKAEDVVKALNDSLARQKNLAEGLADALSEASSGATGGIFSEAARSADELSARLEKIEESFKRIREERIAASNVDIQQRQATANSVERRLANEQDVGVRIVLQSELSRLRDEIASATSQSQTPRSLQENIQRFRDATLPLEQRRIIRGNLANRRITSQEASQQIENLLSGVSSASDLRRLLQERISATQPLVNTSEGVSRFFRNASSDTAAREIAALQEILAGLEDFGAASDAVTGFIEEATKAGESLAQSRSRIEDFGEGVASASEYSNQLDSAGRVIEKALQSVTAAQESFIAEEISLQELQNAVTSAAQSVERESATRDALLAGIAEVFNEEEAARRDELRKAEDAAARQAGQDKKRAEEELRSSVERGRRLLLGDRGRATEDLRKQLADISAAGGNAQSSQSFVEDTLRQAAPAVFALTSQTENAILQGPSRQPLTASDISTQQGAAELNRLLRGDDAAREQNIVELQKQTAELVEIKAVLKGAGVAD